MPIHRTLVSSASLVFALSISVAFADAPYLRKPIDPADVAACEIRVLPDGAGLPAGCGKPAEGVQIYAEKCVACHDKDGKNKFGFSPLFGGGKAARRCGSRAGGARPAA